MNSTLLKAAIALTLAIATIAPATAQDDDPLSGRWWTMAPVVERLGLSAEQVTTIDEIAISTQERIIDHKGEGDKAKLRLRRLLEADTLDESAIESALQKVNEAQCAVNDLNLRYRFEVAKVLTRDQRRKMTMLHEQRGRRQQMRRNQRNQRR